MNTPPSKTEAKMLRGQSKTVIIAIGVSTAIRLILSSALIITVVVPIWSYKRRSAKKELYTDTSYSTLTRESGQQIQPQSVQQEFAQLYDQVHLSPSTGQTEFIPKSESERTNINSPSTTLQNSHPTTQQLVMTEQSSHQPSMQQIKQQHLNNRYKKHMRTPVNNQLMQLLIKARTKNSRSKQRK